jgi:hypothetical protein
VTILLKDCGDGITLPLSGVDVWTGNMGQPFSPTATTFPLTTSVVCGNIACGATDVPVPEQLLTRPPSRGGFYDKDGISNHRRGTCAKQYPYTVTQQIVSSKKQQHFAWPVLGAGSDERAAFPIQSL